MDGLRKAAQYPITDNPYLSFPIGCPVNSGHFWKNDENAEPRKKLRAMNTAMDRDDLRASIPRPREPLSRPSAGSATTLYLPGVISWPHELNRTAK
jgi:hypothetical protein